MRSTGSAYYCSLIASSVQLMAGYASFKGITRVRFSHRAPEQPAFFRCRSTVDRHALDVDAEGSSPSAGIARVSERTSQSWFWFLSACSQGGMASLLGSEDRWFESSRADFSPRILARRGAGEPYGALAELERHPTVDRTPAQGIRGSSPLCSILEEWPSGLRRRTANPQWATRPPQVRILPLPF